VGSDSKLQEKDVINCRKIHSGQNIDIGENRARKKKTKEEKAFPLLEE